MRTHLYTTFVDLTKAFNTVHRDGLWKVMQKFGFSERFTHMVRQLHDGMTARVTGNGMVSEAFAVANGMKQGCVMAPILLSLMFSAMLMGRLPRPPFGYLMWEWAHWLTDRRTRLRAPKQDSQNHCHLTPSLLVSHSTHNPHWADDVVAAPAQSQLFQLSINAEKDCSFQHFRVRYPILPFQLWYSAKAAEMEVVELPRLILVDRPRFRSIQQRRQYDSFVHLEFGAKVETISISNHVLHASQGLTGCGDPIGDLIVDFGAAGEIAAQVHESVHRFHLGAIDIDVSCGV
ncbi:unnamed protein product [Schistocephalus solidus]|uniref:Reverse transcriptase domain-containing protein n=1 Tax=Schistocephalus solidus TaxID=70667 RepID=A0A183T3T3_SCHSO|nr:unnamed protein product [Schistocephalus solidus]